MGTLKNLLTIARKELGNTESPAGSNRTKYGKWFGLDGNPWCMMFIMWCFCMAGVKLPKKTASCGDLMRAAQAAGCWVTSNFQPGDVVIYDFSGQRKITQHCGIVEVILNDYGVQAIEGNTSADHAMAASSGHARSNSAQPLDGAVAESYGSQDNGGMVCRKNRAQKYIIGAIRPQFDMEKEDDDMKYYKTLADVPSWYKAAVQKAVNKGALNGTGSKEINVSEDLCRTLTVLDRLGKLD